MPWFDEGELLRKTFRIGRGREGFAREDGGGSVMTVGERVLGAEARHDEVGPEAANDPDDVTQDLFAVPDAERFVGAFGKAEIVRAGEKLFGVIGLAGSE